MTSLKQKKSKKVASKQKVPNADAAAASKKRPLKPTQDDASKNDSKNEQKIKSPPASAPAEKAAFSTFSLHEPLQEALKTLEFASTTPIQTKILESSLNISSPNKSIFAIAESGTGKTLGSCISVLNHVLTIKEQQEASLPCATVLVVLPTKEMAEHVERTLRALLETLNISRMLITGEDDIGKQRLELERQAPTMLIGTPGRICQLLDLGTFSLIHTRYLILDEADKLFTITYEKEVNRIIGFARSTKITYLLSTTLTKKLRKLQKSLDASKTVLLQIIDKLKYASLESVPQRYLFVPEKFRHAYLAYLLNENPGMRILVFANENITCIQLSIMLRAVGFSAAPIAGVMKERHKANCLKKFNSGDTPILIVTDMAIRGLSLANVEMVVNYELPIRSDDYVRRLGRIAQFDPKEEIAVDSATIISQYDLEYFQKIEEGTGIRMEEYPQNEEHIKILTNTVDEAWRLAQSRAKVPGETPQQDQVVDDAVFALSKKRKRKDSQKDKNSDKKQERKTKRKRHA